MKRNAYLLEGQMTTALQLAKRRKHNEELDKAEYRAGTKLPPVEHEPRGYMVIEIEAGSEAEGPIISPLFAGHSQIIPTQMAAGGSRHMAVREWSMKIREQVTHFNRTSSTHGYLLRELRRTPQWNAEDDRKQRAIESDAPLNLVKVAEKTRGKRTSVLKYLLGIEYREENSQASELTRILEGENIAIYSCDLRNEHLATRCCDGISSSHVK